MGKVLIDRSSGYFFAIYAENPVGETMDVPDFVFENPSEWMLVEGKIVPCPDYIDFVDGFTAVRLKREQIQLVVDGDVVGTGVAARKGLLQGHLLEKSD